MNRSKLLAAVAIGLGLSGCTTSDVLDANHNPSLYSVHQPVVQRTDFTFDVATDSSGLSPAEQSRLNAWFSSIDLRYGDTVTIDEATGYENAAARQDVANVAGRYGLLVSAGAPMTEGEVAPGSLRVIASRATASVPGCPSWNADDLAPVNNTSTNYGCATNSNLAAMVANPNDLVVGQDGNVQGSAGTAARAMGTYRARQPTGQGALQQTSTQSQGN